MYFFAIFMFDLDHLGVFHTDLTKEAFQAAWKSKTAIVSGETAEDPFLDIKQEDGKKGRLDLLESLSDRKLYLSASAALGAGIRFQKKTKMHQKNCNRAMHSKKKRKKKEYNII